MGKTTDIKMNRKMNRSLHLVQKYSQIFVHGHYLSQEANRFSRVKLEKNCER